ncbi:MAG: hypothetical protein LQ338_002491 [Usnochroma carphineum]|nr:MAG: hypothetical protein LQ338_007943 [Usnochroma carphineum]KAI4128939.1 MAG: hypothetical protein LQ338_002491 [Usnochroma carphineum]
MAPLKNSDPGGDIERDTPSQWEQDGGPEPSTSASSTLDVRSRASSDFGDGNGTDGPLPLWLRESSKSFHWRWVPYRLRHFARSVAAWTRGPDPPQLQMITPLFPSIQEAPVRLIARYFPRTIHRGGLLALFIFCWLLAFSLVLHHSASAGNIKGYGKPQPIWCGASYWSGGNSCGLNGNRCRPFDNAYQAFRCPANCKSVHVTTPHAVGALDVNYRPFVIGGPVEDSLGSSTSSYIYRADSFVCQAAIHAGVVSNQKGGCGVLKLVGEHSNYTSTKRNGIQSIPFDASFPKSFTFVPNLSSSCIKDLRWPLLAVTVTFTTLLSLFTSSPTVFFPTVFTMLFFHVGLVSDPPTNTGYASLSSLIIGRFLPAAFVAAVFYRFAVKPQQENLTAYIERTVLWLGGAWVGSLNNYTFDFIPIQRLTPSDLRAQPGARLALVIIVVSLFAIACGQVYYLRLEGRLRRYLAVYAIFVTFLIACVILPSLNLRIHHYFLALLLLPGTRVQTRPSLLYQGILVGLFVNGTARWGFDSILQTTRELRGPDGPLHSALPDITSVVSAVGNITFEWAMPPLRKGYDGISVLVDDVERWRWYVGEGEPRKTFERQEGGGGVEYFRFAYMRGSGAADFTGAGVWGRDGGWRWWEGYDGGG